MPGDSATTEQIEQIREDPGLESVLSGVQFGIWFANVLQATSGESFFFKKTVAELIAQRLRAHDRSRLCTIDNCSAHCRASRCRRGMAPRAAGWTAR
jgi:peptide/nickel transport system permease protein